MSGTAVAGRRPPSKGAMMGVLNPATGDVVDSVSVATREEVEAALAAAQGGFREWSATPVHERVAILRRYTDLLERDRAELSALLTRENGKPLIQAGWEIDTGVRLTRSYAEEAQRLYGLAIPGEVQAGLERDLLITRHEPFGVMGAILPFNFPIDLFTHKVAPALAAGNAVVLKPAEDAPLTVLRAAELMHEAGVPSAAIQIVTGGSDTGRYLVESDKVELVSFTGSTDVGVSIAQTAAKRLARVFLELGGNDPMVVFADADLDSVVEHAVFGRTLANGQCCCASKRLIVHRSLERELTERLVAAFEKLRVGDPADDSVDVGPLIHREAAVRASSQIRRALDQGAKVAVGTGAAEGAFVAPVILADVRRGDDIARDMEVFAPVLPIIAFDHDHEAIEIANDTRYGLNASLFTRDMGRAFSAAYGIQAGLVAVNGTGLYRPDAAPFGGYKMSGLGREGTTISLSEFTQLKTIALRDVLPAPTDTLSEQVGGRSAASGSAA